MQRGYKYTDTEVRLKKARRIVKLNEQIKDMTNSILANGAYSDKQELAQLKKMEESFKISTSLNDIEKLEILNREKSLVRRAWKIRRSNALKIMDLLNEILENEESGDKGNDKKDERRNKKSPYQ